MNLKDLNPTRQALSLFDEFKNFAFKGNVVDLAIGVIIGGAFGNLVNSLVHNVIMPILGLILPGEKGYVGWVAVIHGKEIPYGKFLGDIVNFLVVAAALFFFIVKFLGWIMTQRKKRPRPLRHQPRSRNCSPRSATCSSSKCKAAMSRVRPDPRRPRNRLLRTGR